MISIDERKYLTISYRTEDLFLGDISMPLGLCRVVQEETADKDFGFSLGEIVISEDGDGIAHISRKKGDKQGTNDNAEETFNLSHVRMRFR